MESAKLIILGFFYGLWDSIKGMALVFYIDAEIHRQNAEKEAERQQRIDECNRMMRRSPSPVPSSASAMYEEQRHREVLARSSQNPDERRLDTLAKKENKSEPSIPFREKKIAKQVLKSCALNGGFTWMSIILFERILLPTLKLILTWCYGDKSQDLHMIWGWLSFFLSIIFGMMWVLPIFLLSKIVSSLWFADIANEAYKVRKGKPNLIPNISKLVADFLFNLVVQALFLVQSQLVNLLPIPYVGEFLCFIHLCLLYSLYAFEYKWFNMGWELHRRLNYIEINWPYFLGFGVPLTVLTSMSSSTIVSSCIFSIFFPLFILSGNEAKPIIGTTATPLRLFSPVIFVSNLLFGGRKINKTANPKNVPQKQVRHHQHRQQLNRQQTTEELKKAKVENSNQQQYRYPQPPTRISPGRFTPTPERQIRYADDGSRILLPTHTSPPVLQNRNHNQRR
ncbi:EI24 domain-containing protein tank [Haematobia irritans]|uniref:EI24 domain-containing protein tank n=1 Tax=Haematobia irritans TaxID=7368 RepID=UPI003F4FEF69